MLKIRNIVSTLFLAESHYDLGVLEGELLNLFASEEDRRAVSLFLNWFKQLSAHGRIESEAYESLEYIYQTEEEVKTMLVTALQKDREQMFQNGLREGEQRGLREGEQRGRIETAKAMLAKEMEMTLISEVTNLPEAQLLQLKEELVLMER